jgi:hypothetical protein
MDPDANLKEQRSLAAKLLYETENDKPPSDADVHRLAELVIALDEWISRGGFYPKDWTKTKPKPRKK